MIHNFYHASRFLGTTSTVLGDVDFLVIISWLGLSVRALYWVSSSGYMLLFIQSVNVAAAARNLSIGASEELLSMRRPSGFGNRTLVWTTICGVFR